MIEAIDDDAPTERMPADVRAEVEALCRRASDRALKVAADARRKSSPSLPQVKP